jgi:hypothetical protein
MKNMPSSGIFMSISMEATYTYVYGAVLVYSGRLVGVFDFGLFSSF